MPIRGLVIGKFYPPHRGHKLLIDTARTRVDELHVIVCDQPGEAPPASLRGEWLREIHPDARVLVVEDRYDPHDSALWADLTHGWLGFAPDVVFTSEDYGERFARYLGCRHVQVDKARAAVPISGTQVRADPLGCWEYLEPLVRAYYCRRVVLVGAESTGKTTLAAALARELATVWVPEFGREYSERRGVRGWTSDEFVLIARKQCEMENDGARRANRVLVCDTDAFATAVWHRRYMGCRSAEVEAVAAAHRRPDLYLLTDVATPFVQDGTRDGEHVRDWMHRAFVEDLTATGRRFVELAGPPDARLSAALAAVRSLGCALSRDV
ncbi:MAG TPA: AAA family ATPase [Fimbriiglobus sp.]|jgi:NadR type nicotinamide-nucleotide adenylyltransferase|nr:AAA family ATPase [Fimbriiglobus sp.]